MKSLAAHHKLQADHGVVCSFPDGFFGYFGWPTVARMDDGMLVIAASGLRMAHVCPFGRTVFCTSTDDGQTWTSPSVINDSPMHDRDAGILSLGGQRLLVSWFSTDTRKAEVYHTYRERQDSELEQRYRAGFARMTDGSAARWVGSWVRASDDRGQTWGQAVKVPVTAPHGPIRCASGELLYLGKTFVTDESGNRVRDGQIRAIRSTSGGATWEPLGTVPLYAGAVEAQYACRRAGERQVAGADPAAVGTSRA